MRRALVFVYIATVLAAATLGWMAGRFWSGQTACDYVRIGAKVGAEKQPQSLFLVPGFRAEEVESVRERFGTAMSHLKFGDKTFWLIVINYGHGVPYTTVGLYAPTGKGTFALCAEANSCGAGWIKPELHPESGVLRLREHAHSKLKGRVILAYNLCSIGTYQSVHGQ